MVSVIEVDASERRIRNVDDRIGGQAVPHDLAANRVVLIDVVAGAYGEVPTEPDKIAGGIERRGCTASDIEVEPAEILPANRHNQHQAQQADWKQDRLKPRNLSSFSRRPGVWMDRTRRPPDTFSAGVAGSASARSGG